MNQFKQDEIEIISFGYGTSKIEIKHATLHGKIRLFLLENAEDKKIKITKELLKFEAPVFLAKTTITTSKGVFEGIGLSLSKTPKKDFKTNEDLYPIDKAFSRSHSNALSSMGYHLKIRGIEPKFITRKEQSFLFLTLNKKNKYGDEWLKIWISSKFNIKSRSEIEEKYYHEILEKCKRVTSDQIDQDFEAFFKRNPKEDPRKFDIKETKDLLELAESYSEDVKKDVEKDLKQFNKTIPISYYNNLYNSIIEKGEKLKKLEDNQNLQGKE